MARDGYSYQVSVVFMKEVPIPITDRNHLMGADTNVLGRHAQRVFVVSVEGGGRFPSSPATAELRQMSPSLTQHLFVYLQSLLLCLCQI